MNKVKVKLLADSPPHKVGDICEMSKPLSRMAVNSGSAEYYEEKVKKAPKDKE